ncbi:hypothetical protein V6N13_043193 [Hibiscus sabdariffa]|uniref:Uncharacterized protein n=1 Tax=Hibiscus sabdariffa TaxID=183260 RepID=A0ABR2G2B0_9ROSI
MRNNELPPDNWTAHYLGYYWETDHPENRVSVASLHRPIFVAKREGQSLGITDSISNPSHLQDMGFTFANAALAYLGFGFRCLLDLRSCGCGVVSSETCLTNLKHYAIPEPVAVTFTVGFLATIDTSSSFLNRERVAFASTWKPVSVIGNTLSYFQFPWMQL